MEYKITEEERQMIIKEIAEAPAKFSFNAINILSRLQPIEPPNKDA